MGLGLLNHKTYSLNHHPLLNKFVDFTYIYEENNTKLT
jgi:hypothetical protein